MFACIQNIFDENAYINYIVFGNNIYIIYSILIISDVYMLTPKGEVEFAAFRYGIVYTYIIFQTSFGFAYIQICIYNIWIISGLNILVTH